MDSHDEESRQSSLPSSLIPHLYTAPRQPRDSSTRTTLPPVPSLPPDPDPLRHPENAYIHSGSPFSSFGPPHNYDNRFQTLTFSRYDQGPTDFSDRRLSASLMDLAGAAVHQSAIPHVSGQRFASPIYSDPVFHTSRPSIPSRTSSYSIPSPVSRDPTLQRTSWREGEAGPSSLLPSNQRDEGKSRGRRGSSQPARLAPQHDMSAQGGGFDPSFGGELHRRDSDGEDYLSQPAVPARSMGGYSSRPSSNTFNNQALLTPPFLVPGSEEPFRVGTVYTYPSLDSYNLPSGSASSTSLRGASPELHPSYHSESRFSTPSGYHGDEYSGSQKGKKRRDSIDSADDNPRKSRTIRKTAVACNFCRGRKLRCNGAKPSCYNCTVRKFDCEYVQVQRRRGPGKAPKGTRTKKRTPGQTSAEHQPDSSSAVNTSGLNAPTDYASSSQTSYGFDALAPELRPYTSVISLDEFSFQPPESSPPYPSVFIPRRRESRARTPRSRETSSEDRSESDGLLARWGRDHGS